MIRSYHFLKSIRVQAIAVTVACGVTLMGTMAQAKATSAPDAPACSMLVHVFAPDARFDEPEDLRTQAVLLFDRLKLADFEKATQGMQPGEARDESDRFKGQDTRWRLLRPVDIPDDPDAFVILPTQVQYLARVPQESPIESLVLVGLPDEDRVIRPALAGRLGEAAGKDAGQLFTAEPASDSDPCPVNPSKTAAWSTNMVQTELTRRTQSSDGAAENET